MELKLGQLIGSVDSLKELAATKLSALVSLKLARFLKRVDEELKLYEEARVEAIKKYGVDKGDGTWEVLPENVSVYQSEMLQLWEHAVNFDEVSISLADLEKVNIEPKHLMALDWLIKE